MVSGEKGWFPYGTDCSRGIGSKDAYCVKGRCLLVTFLHINDISAATLPILIKLFGLNISGALNFFDPIFFLLFCTTLSSA